MKIKFRASMGMNGNAEPDTASKEWRLKWHSGGHVEIGECIYCGSTDNLSDEHSVALAIWGTSKLKSASCKRCQDLIQPHEQYVFKYLWNKAREYLQAPSRKARKSGRWTGEAIVYDDNGKELNVPTALALPFLLLPITRSLPARFEVPIQSVSAVEDLLVVPLNNVGPKISRAESESLFVSHKRFARVVLKTAYCEYIRTIDHSFRSQNVSEFIVDGRGHLNEFFGCILNEAPDNRLHSCEFKMIRRMDRAFPEAIACRLRLFSFLKVPTYILNLGDKPPSNLREIAFGEI